MGGERSSILPRPAILIRPILLYFAVVLILAVAFAIACGSPDGPPGEPVETQAPVDAQAIRVVDFRRQPEVQNTLRQFSSASLDVSAVLYADVTGDGREEAAVPIDSGGTLGNVAFLVFSMRSGAPSLILTRTVDGGSGLVMQTDGSKLVETRGEYGPEDPFCCPSRLRKTTFHWDGAALQVEREEVIANPAGGPKQ